MLRANPAYKSAAPRVVSTQKSFPIFLRLAAGRRHCVAWIDTLLWLAFTLITVGMSLSGEQNFPADVREHGFDRTLHRECVVDARTRAFSTRNHRLGPQGVARS
jgi:hypothetical protein